MQSTYITKYGKFTCYDNDIVFASLLQRGEIFEDKLIINYIIPLLINYSEKIIILDIGAHIGTHTILYSQLLNCKVLAFEPQKKIFNILNKNITDNNLTNCTIYNYAVGHDNLQTTLSNMLYDGYDCKIDYNTTKILNYGGIGLGQNGESVNMITIDSLNLSACHYIKIDVEGAEILVLIGAYNTINKFKPLIWFEHTDKGVTQEMKNSMNITIELPTVFNYLLQFGYNFIKLDNGNILAYTENINI